MSETTTTRTLAIFAAAVLIAGCAGTGSTRVQPKPVLHAGIRAEAMAIPERDEIRHGVKNGVLRLDAGDYESALEHFQSGLRLNPRDGHLHFLHALAYHLQSLSGDTTRQDLAETGYRLALKYDPGNYWAAYMLGQIYFSQRRFLDAENQFSYGLLFAPDNQALLRALSVASYYARNVDVGYWAASRAYQKAPEDPAALRALLFNRAALGDIDGALRALGDYRDQRARSGSAGQAWRAGTADALAERIVDWQKLHRVGQVHAQAGGREVFGSDAEAEGTPLDLDTGRGGTSPAREESGPTGSAKTDAADKPRGETADGSARSPSGVPRMAMIDVIILSTEESRSQARGVNLLAGLQATLTGTLYARSRVSGVEAGSDISTDTTTRFSPTLSLASLTYNLNIFNDGVNKAEVLAQPTLLAVENQTSKFYSGAVLHVEIRGTVADEGSLKELPIGLHMEVTPRFHDEDTVEIVVRARRDNIEERFQETSVRAFAQVTTTSVDATAVLRFGETLILSGMSERENAQSRDGVPFLQHVPILQYLFSRKEDQQARKSVIVLLTPRKPEVVDGKVAARDPDSLSRREPQQQTHTQELRKSLGINRISNVEFALRMLSGSALYRNFRQGDLKLDAWHDSDTLAGAIRRTLGFLYY
jgi:general secretion pathway protein D